MVIAFSSVPMTLRRTAWASGSVMSLPVSDA